MSRTEVLNIYPGRGYTVRHSFQNSYHSAMLLWDYLGKTYIDANWHIFDGKEAQQKLWDLFYDPKVPLPFRAMHGMTFGKAIVNAHNYRNAAMHIRETGIEGHWPNIANIFEELNVSLEPVPMAIGFTMTTVSETQFPHLDWRERQDIDAVEDGGDGSPVVDKWSRDHDWSKVFNVYEELEKVEANG